MVKCPFKNSEVCCDIRAIRYCQSGRKHDIKGSTAGIVINGEIVPEDKDARYIAYICNLDVEKNRSQYTKWRSSILGDLFN